MKRYTYTPAHFRSLSADFCLATWSSENSDILRLNDRDPLLIHFFSDRKYSKSSVCSAS